MNIKALAEQYKPEIIQWRRYFHQVPELSGQEVETTKAVSRELTAMGLKPVLFSRCQGLYCEIPGGRPGKRVALRADIDGLKIEEKTGLPFASSNGAMHGCGHDAHIAIALGAARILTEIKDTLPGNVRMIFQPAEEIALGAKWCIEEGVLDNVDAVYSTHVWGMLDAPLFDFSPGRRMAANNRFRITIHGVSSHGGAPHLGVDAVTTAASVIMNLQLLSSRWNDPCVPLTLTIGSIHGGSAYNVLANQVVIEGSVRHFRTDTAIEEEMRQIIQHSCEALNAQADFVYDYLTQPIFNNQDELNTIAKNALVRLYGKESLGELPAMMSSEDFSAYMEKVPGILGFIGSRNPAKGLTAANHQETYSVDEAILQRGSAVMAQFALDYLHGQENHRERG